MSNGTLVHCKLFDCLLTIIFTAMKVKGNSLLRKESRAKRVSCVMPFDLHTILFTCKG